MEEEIVREIIKECKNWKERLLVKLFAKMFIKVYHISRVNTINNIIKSNAIDNAIEKKFKII